MYQNPSHAPGGASSNPHLRPAGSAPMDPNPASNLSEQELREYFDQFCKSPLKQIWTQLDTQDMMGD